MLETPKDWITGLSTVQAAPKAYFYCIGITVGLVCVAAESLALTMIGLVTQ
jgi:hypothetical protein